MKLPYCHLLGFCVLVAWFNAIGARPAWADSDDKQRYLAVFVDGKRVYGKSLVSWHDEKAKPRLDSTQLADSNHRLRWLRDLMQAEEDARPIRSYVEFVGGDRLPGNVVGYAQSGPTLEGGQFARPHLYVAPAISVRFPERNWPEAIRVRTNAIRRVVWEDLGRGTIQPSTLFFRDGRSKQFRSLRWGNGEVHILSSSGTERVAFNQIAEVHLPAADQWEAYLDELAILSPQLKSSLVRIATSDGLVATVSEQRMRPAHHGSSSDIESWYPWIQPAWSLDVLAIHFPTIHTWNYFHPEEVPLSRLTPTSVRQQSIAGGLWKPRVDRNVQGGPLRSGGQRHGWGLGVHAFSEIEFELSPLVAEFSSKIGLDRLAGVGGCARARIFFKSTNEKPAFESKHLIGSSAGVSTGGIPVPDNDGKPVALILQADPATDDRPAGSDPLDIRDSVDWLEPMLKLDVEKLREAVFARRMQSIPAFDDWRVDYSNTEEFELGSYWTHWGVARYGFHQSTFGKGEIVLSRRLQIGPDDNWLVLGLWREDKNNHDKIIIRIDGETIAERGVPFSYDKEWVDPLSVPINAYQGREVDLSIVRQSSNEHAAVVWNFIELRSEAPYLYRVFEEGRRAIEPKPSDVAGVRVSGEGCYSGRMCLAVSADAKRAALEVPVLKIREQPGMGEYRYLRFAMRKQGKGRAYVELTHARSEEHPFRFDAGTGEPVGGQAIRVWPHDEMQEWVVVTRDLFHDFGAFDLEGVELGMLADGMAQFDHIYLAQKGEDLDDAIAERTLSPGDANRLAATKLFKGVREKVAPTLVRVQVGERSGGGVIISSDGLVFTTGYLAGKAGEKATVRLSDGQELTGKTQGIHRARDISFIQLDDAKDLPAIERAKANDVNAGALLMAMAFSESKWESNSLGSAIVLVHGTIDYSKWVSLAFERKFAGGVVVDGQGRLVGVLSRAATLGGTICASIDSAEQASHRIKKNEVFDPWPVSIAPTVGAVIGPTRNAFDVLKISPGGPADKAGMQVGDHVLRVDDKDVAGLQDILSAMANKVIGETVSFEIRRGEEKKTIAVEVVSRR